MGMRATVRAAVVAGLLAATGAVVVPVGPARAAPSTGFESLLPTRQFDTRDGTGGAPTAPLPPGVETPVQLNGVPVDATRAAVRITVSEVQAAGELYVRLCGATGIDTTAAVELVAGTTDTALWFAPVQVGRFCLVSTAPTHVTVDLEGYESPGGTAAFVASGPTTVLQQVSVTAGSTRVVSLAAAGVPAGSAVAASVTLLGRSPSAGFVTLYDCGLRPLASTLNLVGDDQLWGTAAIGRLSVGGEVCIYSSTAAVVSLVVFGHWAPGATPTATGPLQIGFEVERAPGFVATEPARLFDTRSGPGGPVGAGQVYELDLADAVPPTATDVVMNVTVTEPSAAGFVTVYPCESGRPLASNLNFVAAQTVPNLVTVSLGSDARVCFYSNVRTHLIADSAGWYQAGGGDGFVTVTPRRLFDTRSGARLGAGSTYELDLSTVVGADTSAVVMNVTVTETGAPGFVTAYPCESGRPNASNLNFVAGQTVPNLVTVAVGSDRRVCLYTSGPAHLLADLAGWYASSSDVGFVGLRPERLFDTREVGGPLDAGEIIGYPYGAGPGIGGLGDAVVALVMNITAVEPTGPGFVTAYPCESGVPTVSNVNYVRGDVVPNLSIVRVDALDRVCFYSLAPTHLIADAAGYFTTLPLLTPVEIR